jgi:hypothetical protein
MQLIRSPKGKSPLANHVKRGFSTRKGIVNADSLTLKRGEIFLLLQLNSLASGDVKKKKKKKKGHATKPISKIPITTGIKSTVLNFGLQFVECKCKLF